MTAAIGRRERAIVLRRLGESGFSSIEQASAVNTAPDLLGDTPRGEETKRIAAFREILG